MLSAMDGLEVAVVLGLAVLAGGVLQQYFRVPAPWSWVGIGAGVSFVPGFHDLALAPDVVLYIFLPALLYWESLNVSLRRFAFDLRVILLLSVGLVFATAAAVAGVATVLGVAFPVALVLGAILSPTDATAVSAMAPRLPRRIDVMLRGESLINDAGALALYAVAVSAVVAGRDPDVGEISLRFLWALVVGAAVGVAAGYVVYLLRRVATQPSLEATISVLTPFALYLPAEVVGGSGVVAVVTGGLLLSRLMPRVVSSRSRVLGFDFWRVSSFVINGALFVLIGLQARAVLEYLLHDGLHALWLTLVITATVFAVRLGWVALMAPAIRLLDRRPTQRARRVPFRVRALLVWGGFRGAVSLAAALAVPALIADGGAFPDRELVVFVTFGTILVLLVGQGATMPLVLRRANIPNTDDEAEAEHQLATRTMAEGALQHLERDAVAEGAAPTATERVRDHHLRALQRVEDHELRETDEDVRRLTLRGVTRKREALEGLRRENRIDDDVYLRIQGTLDHEELRWEHPHER